MKSLLLTILTLLTAITATSQTLPTFSTAENPVYYYVQFKTGEAFLTDQGKGKNLQTAARTDADGQLWAFIGTQNDFVMLSKAGNYVSYNGSRFQATASGVQLKMVKSTASGASDCWELQRKTESKSMNQWGGSGAGKELGEWDKGDGNNPVRFLDPTSLPETDPQPAKLPEWGCSAYVGYVPDNLFTLWYKIPVTKQTVANPWMEYALPIGNGQLGAMIYGGIRQDIVQFNEKTLWTGSSTNYDRGAGYQNFGHIYIEDTSNRFGTTSSSGVKDYVRTLDLSNATATAEWKNTDKSVTFRREYIASYPDQVVAVHLTASEPGQLSQRIYLWNAHNVRATYSDGEGSFEGKLETVSYNARMKVVVTGGTTTTDKQGVHVTNADEILILLSAVTDYDPIAAGYVSGTNQIAARAKATVDAAAQKGWEAIYSDHVADYKEYFDRCQLDLDGAVNTKDTKALIDAYANLNTTAKLRQSKDARQLEQLYFHYGRYLLISSSRGIDLPNNLQGIWNNSNSPAWNSDIHANINIQMNYWPAEITGLPEMHEKYLNYLYNMALVQPQWQAYAKNWLGQSTGWACFTENNIFGNCTNWMATQYPEAGAWSVDHMWQHYRFTRDTEFLKKKALPVMISCVRMWMERLVKANDGTWECPNEWSPEHGPTENATAHSQQIVWNLFDQTIKAIELVGVQEAGVTQTFLTQLKNKFKALDTGLHTETYNGTYGNPREGVSSGETILREWKYTDYATGNGSEAGHRHLSHMMALYPFANLPATNPYYQPAVRSLMLRGLPSTGWSMGWKVNLWARALQPQQCVALLQREFKHSTSYGTDQNAGGIYYNLFDSHAPFQIDGNFGICAGMAEMLLQSHTDTLQLLPCLPETWQKGSIRGLRAVGGFIVDISWENGKAVRAEIKNPLGVETVASYGSHIVKLNKEKGSTTVITFDENGVPTTGICSPKDELNAAFSIQERTVTLTGNGVKGASIFDLQGRKLLATKKRSFQVPATAGSTVVLRLATTNGKEMIHKLHLK